jgi:mannosyl-3-phosphoglycerate phosphatase
VRVNESIPEGGRTQIVVFTDLDGSLLDHDSYSFENARPALACIRDRRIPLVFTSSKTKPEIEVLQAIMKIQEPFIVENGAAVFFPDGYRGWLIEAGFHQPPYRVIQLGASYGEIRRFVQALLPAWRIHGFGDMSVADIVRLTGLSPAQATLAKKRDFTEPFLLEDDSRIVDLGTMAEARGLKVTRGGRFYHLIGSGQDKGIAVRQALSVFRRHAGPRLVAIGLGDSANDRAMLESVDIAILIPHPDGSYENLNLPNLRRALYPGSRGWNDMILELLETLAGMAS